jgi:hypothetical protein
MGPHHWNKSRTRRTSILPTTLSVGRRYSFWIWAAGIFTRTCWAYRRLRSDSGGLSSTRHSRQFLPRTSSIFGSPCLWCRNVSVILLSISVEIAVEEYTAGIKKCNENTSTSPSGRYLGLYKATLGLGKVTEDVCEMLNKVLWAGLIPKRWCRALSVRRR